MIGFEPQVEEKKRKEKKKKKCKLFFLACSHKRVRKRGIRTNDPYFIGRDPNRLNYLLERKCKLKYY
jgi:hypothetical protein